MAFFAQNFNSTNRAISGGSQSDELHHQQSRVVSKTSSLGGVSDGAVSSDVGSEDSYPPASRKAFSMESTTSSMDTSMAFRKIRYLSSSTYVRPQRILTETDNGSMNHRQMDDDETNDGYISIPPLNLKQVENWSGNDLTYTHRKGDEKNSKEIIRKTEAFQEWLSAKIESEKYAKCRKKEAEMRLDMALELNERDRLLAKEQVLQEWHERKNAAFAAKLEALRKQQAQEVPRPTDTQQESIKNYNAWLEKKLIYEKAVRANQQQAQTQMAELEQIRRDRAINRYEQWLKGAHTRPKPVPLNKGLLSLKGSISKMYVNPKPWVFDADIRHPGDTNTL